MSLVDYDSSSSEEEDDDEDDQQIRTEEEEENKKKQDEMVVEPSSHRSSVGAFLLPPPMIGRLPDASVLLGSSSFSPHQTVGTDHSSRVAAAMAESESRKRTSNGPAFPYTRSKLPRGKLPHSKNVVDTGGGLLSPPQLRGRSNVVTEDISKLFVRRDGQNLRDGN